MIHLTNHNNSVIEDTQKHKNMQSHVPPPHREHCKVTLRALDDAKQLMPNQWATRRHY